MLAEAHPFHHFNSPLHQWEVLPTFLLGEIFFLTLAALALVHAVRTGRDHVLIWVGALVAGTANDFIFMALPLVDNFWQAQGTIMLTERMPLYIPSVYVCFLYLPTVTARRLGLSRGATAALGGLLACLFYAPYDIVGAKFLWWTWHDTDTPIATRILGAPTSSTLWVLTFAGSFGWLVSRALPSARQVSAGVAVRAVAVIAGLTTLTMMLQMTALQQVDGGTPRYGALAVGLVVYALVALRGLLAEIGPRPVAAPDRMLRFAIAAHLLALGVVGASFDPETHVSTGVHQATGECYVDVTDITGLTRHQWLCVSDFDEDFSFDCVDEPPAGEATWYTICGRPHDDAVAFRAGLSAICALGVVAFWLAWNDRRRRSV